MNLERGLWLEGLVGGLATLVVAWPIVDLLREPSWLDGALLLVLVVVVTGGLLRTLGVNPSATVLLQTLAALVVMWWRYAPDTLWYGLPTTETAERATALLQEAGRVLQTYAAPAPTTEGVEFLVVAMLGLCALSVDAIGVTGRAPATAGLPLVAAFMVSVSNTGRAMEPQYFIAAAAVWLLMMGQQGDRIVGSWSSADRREAVGSHDVSHGPTGHRTVARVIGVLTVIGALVVASLLPHLPPYLIGEGLARNPDARGAGGGGEVSFTETMDLTADLNSRSTEPVLAYRTDAGLLEPLRVTATAVYRDDGWLAPDYDQASAQGSDTYVDNPQAALAEGVPVAERNFTVSDNTLEAPFLAVAAPVVEAGLGVAWTRDADTDAIRVRQRPDRYSLTYLQVVGGGDQLPEGIGAEPVELSGQRYLEVDEESRPAVEALLDQVVPEGETNALSIAAALQNHLRSGSYVYSLELAENEDGSDAITHFLQTRRGYCTQFATAMVMGARAKGIPARMAVGFLAGERQPDGSYVVLASDAHAWPELLIDGLGWTRFEPTPGSRSGVAPSYARPDISDVEAEPTLTGQPTAPEEPVQTPAGADESLADTLRGLLPLLGRALLVVLALGVLMAVVPWAGRRYREAALRGASTPEDRVEGQWTLLTRSLEDLGIAPPQERSPRQMRSHYTTHAHLDRRTEETLGRVTATLERSRYAAPSEDGSETAKQLAGMGRDVRSVVESVKESLPWNIRANARLLPRSGVSYLRERVGGLLRRRR